MSVGQTKTNEFTVIAPQGVFGAYKGEPLLVSILREIGIRYSPDPDGEWAEKYGTDFEDAKFMMHRFCWCEKDGCPWCGGDAPNFHYKPKNLRVKWYKYIGRGVEANKELTTDELMEMRKDLV